MWVDLARILTLLVYLGPILGIGQAWAGNPYIFAAHDPAASSGKEIESLVIYSSTDIAVARPLIDSFQDRYPKLQVVYHDLQSLDIYERIVEESDRAGATADLVFSSAMDLQLKLVNDGYALRWRSAVTAALPKWANWRNEAFGVTYEPAVIVYHKPSFDGRTPPRTRSALIEVLLQGDRNFFGRVATYDVERSGLGFLFLARDQEHYPDIWRLVSAMGTSGVKLYSNSAAIIERVAEGKFVLGYNILGSYAKIKAAENPDLGIILPEDYTVVLSRIAFIPRAARARELGGRFLDFLLSEAGQRTLAERARLNAILPAVDGPNTASALRARLGASLCPIRVGPGLLVYLDQAKRARLIKRWNQALGGR